MTTTTTLRPEFVVRALLHLANDYNLGANTRGPYAHEALRLCGQHGLGGALTDQASRLNEGLGWYETRRTLIGPLPQGWTDADV